MLRVFAALPPTRASRLVRWHAARQSRLNGCVLSQDDDPDALNDSTFGDDDAGKRTVVTCRGARLATTRGASSWFTDGCLWGLVLRRP
jgi:hypothetical protein